MLTWFAACCCCCYPSPFGCLPWRHWWWWVNAVVIDHSFENKRVCGTHRDLQSMYVGCTISISKFSNFVHELIGCDSCCCCCCRYPSPFNSPPWRHRLWWVNVVVTDRSSESKRVCGTHRDLHSVYVGCTIPFPKKNHISFMSWSVVTDNMLE